MWKMTDQKYLVTEQYKNAQNLNARGKLHARFSTNQYNWFDWVFDHLEIFPEAKILEVGCGNGALWAQVQERIPVGWTFVLGDLSRGMLQDAKHNLAFLGDRARFQVLDAQLIMFENETFDAVIANHMLYHVPNIPRAILEAHRVLKPGGKFYAATNGNGHMKEISELMLGFAPLRPLILDHKIHSSEKYFFSLENGDKFIHAQFSQVKRFLYQDSLAVTEVDPLLKYILSTYPKISKELTQKEVANFHQYLDEQLTRHSGVIAITKSTGLFVGYK